MRGINLDKPVFYIGASLRFFDKGEHYVTRFCKDDVLMLVYDGILKFTEDGVDYEVHPGEYFIHTAGTNQSGKVPSDLPKYLYVHFHGSWDKEGSILRKSGRFDYLTLRPYMEKMDRLDHSNSTLAEKTAVFLDILSLLFKKNEVVTQASRIADFISCSYAENISLETLSEKFHFSKNQIINIFKKQYHMTPFEYLGNIRIRHAQHLLEATGKSVQSIACECGFSDYTSFYKSFMKTVGVSPSAYRNK